MTGSPLFRDTSQQAPQQAQPAVIGADLAFHSPHVNSSSVAPYIASASNIICPPDSAVEASQSPHAYTLETNVRKIATMGYSEAQAREALVMGSNDLHSAIEILMMQAEATDTVVI